MQKTFLITVLSSFALYGCNIGKNDDNFAYGNNTTLPSGDTGTTQDTGTEPIDTSTPQDSGDSGEPASEPGGEPSSEELGDDSFDNPGDVVVADDEDGDSIVEVDLSDASGENNQNQEFYLVVVNGGEDALGYTLKYSVPSEEEEGGEEDPPEEGGEEDPPEEGGENSRSQNRGSLEAHRMTHNPVQPPLLPPPPYTSNDIGFARKEYKVRDSLDDEDSYEKIETILWAVGTNVNIWVDESVYIDWDFECDGVIDQEAFNDSYGFDNCDLETIVLSFFM